MDDAAQDSRAGVLRLLAWAKARGFAVLPATYALAIELGLPVAGVIVATPTQPYTGWKGKRGKSRA